LDEETEETDERRLMRGRRLLCRSVACGGLRLAGVARLIGPDEK
jgi:hypothetical protein